MSAVADTLVTTPTEVESLRALREATGETDGVMERHCVRCFLLSQRLAERRGAGFDREVALCAALLHDIGLYDSVSDGGVYTEEGAELARRIGREAGWDAERVERCAEACARHHSFRAQWELGPEVETLRLADRLEVSGGLVRAGLSRDEVRAVNAQAPRDGFYGGLFHVVWPALRQRPLNTARIFRA